MCSVQGSVFGDVSRKSLDEYRCVSGSDAGTIAMLRGAVVKFVLKVLRISYASDRWP